MVVTSITLHIEKDGVCIHLSCSPQEAFNILMMPATAGLITVMVPEYGMPSMPEPENKE